MVLGGRRSVWSGTGDIWYYVIESGTSWFLVILGDTDGGMASTVLLLGPRV